MKQTKAPELTPSPRERKQTKGVVTDKSPTTVFVSLVLDMSWRLALVVIIPIAIGSLLDSHFKKGYLYVVIGLVFSLLGAAAVVYQSYYAATALTKSKGASK